MHFSPKNVFIQQKLRTTELTVVFTFIVGMNFSDPCNNGKSTGKDLFPGFSYKCGPYSYDFFIARTVGVPAVDATTGWIEGQQG
jgi:hypothetical protein